MQSFKKFISLLELFNNISLYIKLNMKSLDVLRFFYICNTFSFWKYQTFYILSFNIVLVFNFYFK